MKYNSQSAHITHKILKNIMLVSMFAAFLLLTGFSLGLGNCDSANLIISKSEFAGKFLYHLGDNRQVWSSQNLPSGSCINY